ncbi:MAG: TonB-dependent receptor [Bacteroidales bacterium]|nr:TonB-dependent receptor [Bacteroidales bacterium]
MRKFLLTMIIALAPVFLIQVLAQVTTVSGVVTASEDGQPLPGVSVVVKGTVIGTTTDVDGKYSLTIPEDARTLVFTFIGMAPLEVSIEGRTTIDVSLEPDVLGIEEVLVTAFGTARRGAFTGSATQINASKIENRPISNLTSAIEGASPGIQVTAGSGQPGESQSIRVRGFGSYGASNTPLYVVDGVQYSGDISAINPNDIESITVLKDASSTALYGNKAANGVVLITTKRGRPGEGQLTVNASYGVLTRAQPEYELIDAFDYYPISWEAYRNGIAIPGVDDPADVTAANQEATEEIFDELGGYNPFNVPDDQIVDNNGNINPNARYKGDYEEAIDWLGALEQRGQRQDIDMNYQGGTEHMDYFISVGYLLEEGFIIESDLQRFSGRANVNYQATEWLKTGFNINGVNSKLNWAQTGSSTTFVNPIRFTRGIGSIYPVWLLDRETGEYILDDNGEKQFDIYDTRAGGASRGRHCIAEIRWDEDSDIVSTLGGKTYLELTFLKDFKITANASLDQRFYYNTFYNNPLIGDGAPGGRAYKTYTRRNSINFNQLLTYNRTFGVHNFDAVLGHESYAYKYNYLSGARTQQIADDNTELINYVTITRSNSYEDNYTTEGYLGRVNYNYDDRYYITGSFRRDGSSRFAKESRWGDFWSVGLAWRLDQESFIQSIDFIDLLKLRASYGELGNDSGIGYYASQGLYSLGFNNQAEPGILQDKLAAPDLVWESSNSFDAAIEFGLFNRIIGTLEFYHRISENLLFDVPLPLSSGLDSKTENIGALFNQGIEFGIEVDVVKTQDLVWNIGLNLSTLKNEFTKLPQEEIIDGSKKLMVGRGIYDYWLREWWGVDPDDGAALYRAEDVEASSVRIKGNDTLTTDINNAKYKYSGSAIPDIFGSITSELSYKGIQLSFMFTYQVGGLVLDYNFQDCMSSGTYGTGYSTYILNRWQKPGDVTDVPRMDDTQTSNFNATSTRWLTDASFLNLRNLILSYEIPQNVTRRIGASRVRVYLSGENLFLINARKGMNVQQNFSGTTSNVYTPNRVISMGLNVNF